MQNDIHPNQISLFDPLENGGIVGGGGIKKLHHIYNDIISVENLLVSWQEFLCGKRKRKDVAEFSLNFMDNILALHKELSIRKYQHGKYQAFKINDPKPRDIHKASIRDRLVHHAIYRILYPYFDRKFIFDSYSCRIGKGTHNAINRFLEFAYRVSKNNTKTCWILKCDICKFFANIDHEILQNILAEYIDDKDVLRLLGKIVNSFSAGEENNIGLPLGNLTSQLFVNIYLNKLDQFVKRNLRAKYYARYCDDFIIIHEDKKYLEKILPKISKFIKIKLKLSFHPNKVSIETLASGVDFLGMINFSHHRILRTKTKRRIIKKISEKHELLNKDLISKETFNQCLQSYLGILKHCMGYKIKRKINDILISNNILL